VDDDAARRRSRRGRRGRGRDGDLSPLGVPGAEQPDLVPAYAGPTPADPFGSGHVFDIFDVMEQAELNAAQANRAPTGRRGTGSRTRWQPPHWAIAAQPPMLVGEAAATDRPDRGPSVEAWAFPSRPFMLRRDRHAPRWSQQRGAPPPAPNTREPNMREPMTREPMSANGGFASAAPAAEPAAPSAEPADPRTRSVPIESGPPPAPLLVAAVQSIAPEPVAELPAAPDPTEAAPTMPVAADTVMPVPHPADPVASWSIVNETESARPAETQAELPLTVATHPAPVAEAPAPADPALTEVAPEPQLVPANDVVSGPMVQPIVIGSESVPPAERKRGWWRRR